MRFLWVFAIILCVIASCATEKTKEYYYDLGYRAVEAKDYSNAVRHYSQAIKMDGKYTAAYYNRGMAYYQMGIKNLAFKDLAEASRQGDENAKKALKLLYLQK